MSIEQTDFLTTIEPLDGDRPERVTPIIYRGMPDPQSIIDEAGLDIELSPEVLAELRNLVSRRQQAKKAAVHDNDRILTLFPEQKKELSTAIASLDGDGIEKIVQIIYDSMPDLQNSEKEIELNIEELSPAVLTKLWNAVVVSQQAKKAPVHNNGPESTGGNASQGAAATGGIKSMDEEVEGARIRELQEQIKRFNLNDPNGTVESPAFT